MTEEEFVEGLASELPSVRMAAVQWAAETSLPPGMERVLVDALSREGVPRIRDAIGSALLQFSKNRAPKNDIDTGGGLNDASLAETLDDLSAIIRHEMKPAIGWVRSAANREVKDFKASATNSALEALRRRVDGLAHIAAAHRIPTRQMVSLTEALTGCLSIEYPPSLFQLDAVEERSDEIFTDPGLMHLILSNAIQNAVEASRDVPEGQAQVLISSSVNDKSFWLTISNRFTGTSFEYASVSATGRSSKHGHRGIGTRIIEIAAGRLGYEFELRATGSTATFSLRGKRYG